MSFSHKEIPLIDQFVKALVSLENLNRFRWHKVTNLKKTQLQGGCTLRFWNVIVIRSDSHSAGLVDFCLLKQFNL